MEKIEIPFGAHDSELKGWEYTIPDGMEAEIKDGKIIVKEKESEDERIRKDIRLVIESAATKYFKETGKMPEWYDRIVSYLEKQKESLHISESCKENADSFTGKGTSIINAIETIIHENCYGDTTVIDGVEIAEIINWLEKQKERKPVEIHIDNPNIQKFDPDVKITTSDSSAGGDELLYVSNKSYKIGFRDGVNSVKEQKPAEWGEEDNIGWDEAFACVTRAEKAAKNEEELQNAVTAEKWLKEIKFKYYVHPVKQEWSEEDERNKDRAVFYARYYQRTEAETKGSEECISWLKSLRPQPHTVSIKDATKFGNLEYERGVKDGIQSEKSRQWKPSDEQIRPLEYAIDYFKKKKNDVTYLESLYEDLKKL